MLRRSDYLTRLGSAKHLIILRQLLIATYLGRSVLTRNLERQNQESKNGVVLFHADDVFNAQTVTQLT